MPAYLYPAFPARRQCLLTFLYVCWFNFLLHTPCSGQDVWCVTLCSLFIHYLLDFSCFFPLNPSTVWECYWTLTSSVSPPWLGRWAWLIVTLMFVKISETRKKCLLSLITTLLNKKRLSVFLVFVLVFGVLFSINLSKKNWCWSLKLLRIISW